MNDFRKIKAIIQIDFYAWFNSTRFVVLFMTILLIALDVSFPVVKLALQENLKVGPWVLSFVLSNPYYTFLIHASVLFLLCDVPYKNDLSQSCKIRCRNMDLVIGHCVFSFLAILCCFAFLQGMILLMFLPVLQMKNEWGEIWQYTSLQSAAQLPYHIYSNVIKTYLPYQAIGMVLSLNVFAAYSNILFLYLLHYTNYKMLGLCFCVIKILLKSFETLFSANMQALLFFDLRILANIDNQYISNGQLIVSFYCVIAILLCFLIFLIESTRKDYERNIKC